MRAPRRARGFTLLEAIVALVIFSLGAFVLFGWLSANVITLRRVAERRVAGDAVASALELVHGVNPMQSPRGRREVGPLEVEWDAKEVVPKRTAVTQVGQPTAFEVALYELQVRVIRDGREVDRFAVRQVGYKQVRSLGFE